MRLQPLQAVVANFFLDYVDSFISKRTENALYLDNLLQDLKGNITLPDRPAGFIETYSLYMVLAENRDGLLQHLLSNGVEAKVHYPIPLHLQPASIALGLNTRILKNAEMQAGKLLTLPIHQYLNRNQIELMSSLIHQYYSDLK